MSVSSIAAAKKLGREAEQAVVDEWCKDMWPHSQRLRLKGSLDEGDIWTVPDIVIQVKAVVRRRIDLPGWLRATDKQVCAAKARIGLLFIKPAGIGVAKVDRYYVAMRPASRRLLYEAAAWRHDALHVIRCSGHEMELAAWMTELDSINAPLPFIDIKPRGVEALDGYYNLTRPAVVKKMLKEGGWA
jgi:hypothetical protein